MDYTPILESKYNRQDWQDLLHNIFQSKAEFWSTPQTVAVAGGIAKQAYRLGTITLEGGYALAVYEVELNDSVNIARNRRGIRDLLTTDWRSQGLAGAFVFAFSSRESALRFSYASENWSFDHEGNYVKTSTEPMRYTYLLGEGRGCHTANERFNALKASRQSLDDITAAFSVEALTKQFYKELFAWYQWAIEPTTGVTFPDDTSTDTDDRDNIEKKIIRMITRVMFVWFIKQKNLVPNNIFDKNFLCTILKDFDPKSSSSGTYYNAILQNLFFATLNCAIENDEGEPRCFATLKGHRDIKTRYRYAELFTITEKEVIDLFAEVPFLNGGLFECLDKTKTLDGVEKAYYYDGFSRNAQTFANGRYSHRATVPNILFFDDEKGLLSILNRYNFTIEENTPADQQVALDPELLGKVFENLLGAYNPETKETARNQSGSFYTPREIVNYIVDESLIAYLGDNDFHRSLFANTFVYDPAMAEAYAKVAEHLKAVKVLDPACGSGAFPMGLLNRMVEVLQRIAPQEDLYSQKLTLIENCLYGSDIQSIATQITKLRFFISLIVDCERDESKPNFGIPVLPNLETKFVAANTLKTSDLHLYDELFSDSNLVEMKNRLLAIRHRHFNAKSANSKQRYRKQDEALRQEIRHYIISNCTKPNQEKIARYEQQMVAAEATLQHYSAEQWVEDQVHNLFGEIETLRYDKNKPHRDKAKNDLRQLQRDIDRENNKNIPQGFEAAVDKVAAWNPYDQNAVCPFFDPEWMFGIADGFDIVIGNPPYVQLQKNGGVLAKQYEQCQYETFAKTGDLYCLFYERGHQLLKPNGHLCYITSNKWMRAGYGEAIRKFFANNTDPQLLIDFSGVKVFESATVDTNILLFAKATNQHHTRCAVTTKQNKDGIKNLSLFVQQQGTVCSFDNSDSWVILSPIEQSIKRKIEAVGTPLKDWDINIYRGVLTGCNEAFIISTEKRDEILSNCATAEEQERTAELIRPILRGRDIKRYGYKWADLWLINTHNGVKGRIPRIAIEDYPAVKAHLDQYWDKINDRADKGDTPYNLRNCAYMEDFSKPKILYQELSQGSAFIIDRKGEYYISNTGYLLTGEHLDWLLVFLNSPFIEFCFRKFYSISLGDTGLRWLNQYVVHLPILLPIKTIDFKNLSDEECNSIIMSLYGLSDVEIEATM